jgi:hypothetical protein
MQTGDMQQFPEPATPGPEGWVMSPNPKQWFKFDLSLIFYTTMSEVVRRQ